VSAILTTYDPTAPHPAADALRELWLQFEPKSIEGIKVEQREQQETVGIPVPVLKSIGKVTGRAVDSPRLWAFSRSFLG
jgi:hypothetical protein